MSWWTNCVGLSVLLIDLPPVKNELDYDKCCWRKAVIFEDVLCKSKFGEEDTFAS
jgi:hypothetical protein